MRRVSEEWINAFPIDEYAEFLGNKKVNAK